MEKVSIEFVCKLLKKIEEASETKNCIVYASKGGEECKFTTDDIVSAAWGIVNDPYYFDWSVHTVGSFSRWAYEDDEYQRNYCSSDFHFCNLKAGYGDALDELFYEKHGNTGFTIKLVKNKMISTEVTFYIKKFRAMM